MAPVFAHGRLRLYLLKLLDEAPRHGYEVIRLLEERFQGLYAPSAGTVYPRLAKLEQEGLVTHSTEGGRKVYALTSEGRAELAARADEIAGLEAEIRESVSSLAAEIREDVKGAAGDLRREVRAAAQQARSRNAGGDRHSPYDKGDVHQSWDEAKQQWKEQAKRAKEESRRAREDARDARRQAKDARDAARNAMDSARGEMERIARQLQEQVQSHAKAGDWQGGLREGLAELTRELGQFGHAPTPPTASAPQAPPNPPTASAPPTAGAPPVPDDDGLPPSDDPVRDLERLLDRFRDGVRDTARDRGVTDGQLREVRRHLSTAAAHIAAALHRTSS